MAENASIRTMVDTLSDKMHKTSSVTYQTDCTETQQSTNASFFKFKVDKTISKTFACSEDARILTLDAKNKNSENKTMSLVKASDVARGDMVLEPIGNISYKGIDTVNPMLRNAAAMFLFGAMKINRKRTDDSFVIQQFGDAQRGTFDNIVNAVSGTAYSDNKFTINDAILRNVINSTPLHDAAHVTPELDRALAAGIIFSHCIVKRYVENVRQPEMNGTYDTDTAEVLYSILSENKIRFGIIPGRVGKRQISTSLLSFVDTYDAPIDVSDFSFFDKAYIEGLNSTFQFYFDIDGHSYFGHRIFLKELCTGDVTSIDTDGKLDVIDNVAMIGLAYHPQTIASSEVDNSNDNRNRKSKEREAHINGTFKSKRRNGKYTIKTVRDDATGGDYSRDVTMLTDENMLLAPYAAIKIGEARIGDDVIGVDGNVHQISSITAHDIDEDVVEISVRGIGKMHLSKDAKVCSKRCRRVSDVLGKQVSKPKDGYMDENDDISDNDIETIAASELNVGDWVLMTMPHHEYKEQYDEIIFDMADFIPKGRERLYTVTNDTVIWHCQRTFKAKAHHGYRYGDIAQAIGISGEDVKGVLYGNTNRRNYEQHLELVSAYLKKLGKTIDWWRANYQSKVDKVMPRYIRYDDEIAYLLGFYVGDGCKSKVALSYALNIDDKEYHERISDIVNRRFNCSGFDILPNGKGKNKKGIVLSFSSQILANFFSFMVPWNVNDKRVPDFALDRPKPEIDALVRGLTDSDGSLKNQKYQYTSCCYDLVHQIRYLLLVNGTPTRYECLNGIATNGTRTTSNNITGSYTKYVTDLFDEAQIGNPHRDWKIVDGGKYVAARVFSTKEYHYSGKAYQVSVNGSDDVVTVAGNIR